MKQGARDRRLRLAGAGGAYRSALMALEELPLAEAIAQIKAELEQVQRILDGREG